MKKLIIFIGLLTFTASCNFNQENIITNFDNGKVKEKYAIDKATKQKQGVYQQFYESGQIFEEANYKNDTLDGKRLMYYENGQVQYQENYKMGSLVGEYKGFHENGKLKLLAQYINGSINGEWKSYYENGQIKEVVTFKDNLENGPFTEYHVNGKLKAEGTYANGDKEQGELKLYDDNGVFFKKMQCDQGICRTTWLQDTTQNKAPM